jgi:hypothetical protein
LDPEAEPLLIFPGGRISCSLLLLLHLLTVRDLPTCSLEEVLKEALQDSERKEGLQETAESLSHSEIGDPEYFVKITALNRKFWTPTFIHALSLALKTRLAQYPTNLQVTRRELEAQNATGFIR